MQLTHFADAQTSLSLEASAVMQRLFYPRWLKGVHILLSNSQAGPGRKVKQEQEDISRNHVQAF